jgi:glycine hydroxymethyltransferase
VTGGTDNHIVLMDLTSKGMAAKPLAQAMEQAGIVCNVNTVPFDQRKPFDPSGIRIGTAAVSTRGMGVDEMKTLAGWIAKIAEDVDDSEAIAQVAAEVKEVCAQYPVPARFVD